MNMLYLCHCKAFFAPDYRRYVHGDPAQLQITGVLLVLLWFSLQYTLYSETCPNDHLYKAGTC